MLSNFDQLTTALIFNMDSIETATYANKNLIDRVSKNYSLSVWSNANNPPFVLGAVIYIVCWTSDNVVYSKFLSTWLQKKKLTQVTFRNKTRIWCENKIAWRMTWPKVNICNYWCPGHTPRTRVKLYAVFHQVLRCLLFWSSLKPIVDFLKMFVGPRDHYE